MRAMLQTGCGEQNKQNHKSWERTVFACRAHFLDRMERTFFCVSIRVNSSKVGHFWPGWVLFSENIFPVGFFKRGGDKNILKIFPQSFVSMREPMMWRVFWQRGEHFFSSKLMSKVLCPKSDAPVKYAGKSTTTDFQALHSFQWSCPLTCTRDIPT
jgi:hypothetical protein